MAEVVQLKENGELKFLKTHVKAVEGLEDVLKLFASSVESTPLWKGVSSLNSSHTVTPSKALNKCQSGWLLVFAPYDTGASSTSNYDFTTLFVPKGKLGLYITNIYTSNYTWTHKRADISNTKIVGHSSNVSGESLKNVLIEVWEV